MPDADDITKQRMLARKTIELTAKEKDLLRQEITHLDAQISALNAQRSNAASKLSKLG